MKLFKKGTDGYGHGIFTMEAIRMGAFIRRLTGERISYDECARRVEDGLLCIDDPPQIGPREYLKLDRFSRLFNHACFPNAVLRGESDLRALRDIGPGEEITYDYSATVGPTIRPSLWQMECRCGHPDCRRMIGNMLSIPPEQLKTYYRAGGLQDWVIKELRSRGLL